MGSFALSPAAYLDLEDVDSYTLTTWGEAQRDRYIHALFERFTQVSAMPAMGRERPELAAGVRSLPHDHHVIFYEVLDGRCVILRVLHQRRDMTAAFRP
jgi:toxin ParE1/3/4